MFAGGKYFEWFQTKGTLRTMCCKRRDIVSAQVGLKTLHVQKYARAFVHRTENYKRATPPWNETRSQRNKPRVIFFTSSILVQDKYGLVQDKYGADKYELSILASPVRRPSQVRAYSKNWEFALDENSENKVTQTRKCPATITLTVDCTFSPTYLVSAIPRLGITLVPRFRTANRSA